MLAKPSADCFTPQWLSRLAPASFPYAAQAQLRGDLLIVLLLPFICEDSEERAGLFPADIDRAAPVSQLNGAGVHFIPAVASLRLRRLRDTRRESRLVTHTTQPAIFFFTLHFFRASGSLAIAYGGVSRSLCPWPTTSQMHRPPINQIRYYLAIFTRAGHSDFASVLPLVS